MLFKRRLFGVIFTTFLVTVYVLIFLFIDVRIRVLFIINALVSVYCVAAYTFNKNIKKKPVAKGRVIAIVPAYNEEEKLVVETIEGLLCQSRYIEKIYVVDDGSKIPLTPYIHERVHWIRQDNAGKRHAQAAVIRQLDPRDVEFILTVDSDSVLAEDALENLLRAFSDPDVYAATGTVITKNSRKNLLTRIIDINIGSACILTHSSRSLLGAIETTYGAIALYRSEIFFDNLEDYVHSGSYGDDRRLSMYAMLYGKVVSVDDAVCYSQMPETLSRVWKQRVRWAKSGWKIIPFMIVNFGIKQNFFPLLGLIQRYVSLIVTILLLFLCVNGYYSMFLFYILFCSLIRFVPVFLYCLFRRDMKLWEMLFTSIFLTPVEVLFTTFFIQPGRYFALFKLKDKRWMTR